AMSCPLDAVVASFALRGSTSLLVRKNLNAGSVSKQKAETIFRISSAFFGVAETWTFHPWSGRVDSHGPMCCQTSETLFVQPVGASSTVREKAEWSYSQKVGDSKNSGSDIVYSADCALMTNDPVAAP